MQLVDGSDPWFVESITVSVILGKKKYTAYFPGNQWIEGSIKTLLPEGEITE